MDLDIIKLYKSLRNRFKRSHLDDVLYISWAYNNHMVYKLKLPQYIPNVFNKYSPIGNPSNNSILAPWDIDSFLQLGFKYSNRFYNSFTFNKPQHFTFAINQNKLIEDSLFKFYKFDILNYLIRLGIKQFPYQTRIHHTAFPRFYILYQPLRDEIAEHFKGLSLEKLYLIGMTLTGYFLIHPKLNLNNLSSEIKDFSIDEIHIFLEFFSASEKLIKDLLDNYKDLDESYGFRFNPIMYYPFIQYGDCIYCPSTFYALDRLTHGLKYDFHNEQKIMDKIGSAFEDYVANYSKKIITNNQINIGMAENYKKGKRTIQSIDLVVSDNDAHLFVEVKHRDLVNKKIRESEKGSLDLINKIVEILFQSYKSLFDYKLNLYPSIKYSQSKIKKLFIVGQSDIYIFSEENLDKPVKERLMKLLSKEGVDTNLIEEIPYYFCNIAVWEYFIQIIEKKGIKIAIEEKIEKDSLPVIKLKNAGDISYVHPDEVFELEQSFVETLREEISRKISE